jgi:hypothetical protein
MNCDEVIRELAVPTEDRDLTALAEHLSHCPPCAGWAERANRFDRLWELTRPPEPSPDTWDSVWARVTASLDASTQPSAGEAARPIFQGQNGTSITTDGDPARTPRSRSSRRWVAFMLVGVAQAAAVLLAIHLTWYSSTRSLPIQADNVATPDPGSMTVNVEIEEGHRVVIRWEGLSGKVEDRTPDISDGVDDWLLGLNAVEALADLSVALKE